MPELLNAKYPKRVIFPKGAQNRFLLRVLKQSKISNLELANKIGVSQRTLNDWKKEKYTLSLLSLKKICEIADLDMPTKIKLRDAFWYTKLGGEIAGKLVYKKYGIIGGDKTLRKKKWQEWWNKTGKFNLNNYFVSKNIKKPKYSALLAEFAGVMIGDGGITKKQVTISLNYKTDKEYIFFIKNLIKKLFDVRPALYIRKSESIINIVVSRSQLVSFCKSIGLKIGNKLKQDLDIPSWIKINKNFRTACLRGIIDTDGCVFNECHKIKNKKYCYPRLSLVSASNSLRLSVFQILKELGFTPKIRNNRSVQLENRQEIIRYFQFIGTNNFKHKKRFRRIIFGRVG